MCLTLPEAVREGYVARACRRGIQGNKRQVAGWHGGTGKGGLRGHDRRGRAIAATCVRVRTRRYAATREWEEAPQLGYDTRMGGGRHLGRQREDVGETDRQAAAALVSAGPELQKGTGRKGGGPRPSKTTRSIAWVRTLTVAAPTQLQPRRRVRISSTAPSISGAAPLHLISHLKLSRVRIFSWSCGTLHLFPARVWIPHAFGRQNQTRVGCMQLCARRPNAGRWTYIR